MAPGKTVGFIGLGIMGLPMAGHLLKAGYQLLVHDLNPAAVQTLASQGAKAAASPAQAAQQADFIITMLPDSPQVEQVALGPAGLIEQARPGQLYADMSTIAPSAALKIHNALKDRGLGCLDAPVSGGQVGAEQAILSIMVGGQQDDFDRFLPLFQCMGKTITLCGPAGSGQIVKACNQIQFALTTLGMAEALVFGTRAGVDPAIILQVLSGGYSQSRTMDVRGPKVIRGDFTPGFKAAFHLKDLNIVMQTGMEMGVPLPGTGLAHSLLSAMQALGRGDMDHSGLITIIEDLAATQARTKAS